MVIIESINLERIGVVMQRYVKELGFSAKEVVLKQSGLLAKEIYEKSPPKRLGDSQKKAVGFSKNVFSHMRNKSKMPDSKAGGTVWLASGPQFLLGTDRKNLKDEISVDQMRVIYKAKTKGNPRFGKAYDKAGKRGPQTVVILNRVVVSKPALKAFQKTVFDSFGKMKAAWAVSAIALNAAGNIKAWVARHIPEMKKRGNFVIPSLLGDKPTITIVATAKGIEGDVEREVIRNALISRFEKMKKDVALYLKGTKKRAGFSAHQ